MIALSVRQPWAWLICNAGKDIENRDWRTNFRGRVLIHAGKTMTKADYQACCIFIADMRTDWRLPAYDILRGECGGIVGETRIVDCLSYSESPWFCGEYGLLLKDSKPLPFKPCRGALGFFNVDFSMTPNFNLPPGVLDRDEPDELTCPQCLATLPVEAFDVDLLGNAECPKCGRRFVRE